MADDVLAVDRRGFILASAAGIATVAGCSSGGGGDADGNDTEPEFEPVQVGYGGVPVQGDRPDRGDTNPPDDSGPGPDGQPTDDGTSSNDDQSTGDDSSADDDPSGDGDSGGYGSPPAPPSSPSPEEPSVTYVVVDGVLYGAPYTNQSAENIPYDDPEEDPCLGYGNGPYGGVVEEGETPACRREAET